ncbi:flagellin FliC [Polynucleobacter sp. JS-Mosq-20-D10]|uniref:flagellin n=1 Tax=Polynucleobacter sp. JS-Mosq-20-D10 TaxID=2576922 RepID=UPI001BFD314D|nr:flagellin [Polynucleobacter sp. JS-Mosq-20-D10]QWE00883.1 flagellin FliC [Polynucleobacter sp. JS-Mosq-20-D10]
MSTVINTNMASVYAQNNLSTAQANLATSVQRLSSGVRINSAKDDSAGLAISMGMSSQIFGIEQANRNLSDVIGMAQVAETALSTIQDMLLRMKTLGTEFGNNALSVDQKTAITTEAESIIAQIDLTIKEAKYNGVELLDTSGATTYDIQSGVEVTTTISFTVANATVDTTAGDFSAVDADLLSISNERAKMGALVGRAIYSSQNLMAQSANIQAARSAIVDTDFASETARLTKGQIMQQAATAMLAQANQMPNVILSLLK